MLNVKVDVSGLNRGIALAQQYSRRAPADTCNFVAKEVAYAAFAETPVTGAAKVDYELDVQVIVTPVIGKRGQPLKRMRKTYKGGTTSLQTVPIPALIIQARANPNSFYNQITNQRYALGQSPFKGVSRAAGRAAMALLVDLMIKERHKSANGFIRAGFLAAAQKLKRLVQLPFSAQSSFSSQAIILSGQNANSDLGNALPANRGQTTTQAEIESDVGLQGKNAESHNRALMYYGLPALQRAVDGEGRKQMEYFLRKQAEEELQKQVNKEWSGI